MKQVEPIFRRPRRPRVRSTKVFCEHSVAKDTKQRRCGFTLTGFKPRSRLYCCSFLVSSMPLDISRSLLTWLLQH